MMIPILDQIVEDAATNGYKYDCNWYGASRTLERSRSYHEQTIRTNSR